MTEPILRLKNINYHYQNLPALVNLNLEIRQRDKIAILGANGSGKSTLLKILDGLIFPSSGEYVAFGKKIDQQFFNQEENEYFFRRRVGFVFQDPDVQLFSPTVFDEVAFGPLHMNFPKEEVIDRTNQALSVLGIGKLKDRIPHQLSGGEKKKVALASVLSIKPEVWLFDEPTASLDPKTVSTMIEFIDLKGGTIICATHDLAILEEISNQVIVLSEDHQIIRTGKPTEVLTDTKFLIKYNLMHEHKHIHKDKEHRHPHAHYHSHRDE
jgi:cobalt/nickel transport system ATP-binding protein